MFSSLHKNESLRKKKVNVMPDVVMSIREGMKKLVLLKHDDDHGGGPAHINTHWFNPGNNKNTGNKKICDGQCRAI